MGGLLIVVNLIMVWRKLLAVLLVISFILFPAWNTAIYAQADNIQRQTKLDFEKSYKDYISKLEDYKKAYPLYVTAKAQYLRSKTQKSESTLMDAGVTILKLRDEVIIYYLDALIKKYKDTDGASDDTHNVLQVKVNEEVKWYEEHILGLPLALNLEDLNDVSTEAQTRKRGMTDRLAYAILLGIVYAKTEDYSTRLNDLMTEFTQKFDVIRADTREGFAFDAKKVALIDKYINEIQIIISRSNDKRSEVLTEIDKTRVRDANEFSQYIQVLVEASQYQKDATFKLIETIGEIKVIDSK